MKRILTSLILVSIMVCAQSIQQTTVDKKAIDNPTIAINAFNGSKEARTKLERMLQLSGWFHVLPESQASKAQIQMQVGANEVEYALSLQAGTQKHSFSKRGNNLDDAARQIVDDILLKLFNVQALCNRRILFVQPDQKKDIKEICSCYIDGSGFERLTMNSALSSEPAWGHSGAVVYTLAKNNALHVVLMDLANNRQRVVSSARGLNSSASLHRDGRQLALSLSFDNQVDLYCLDLATNQRRRLTNDKSVESSPCWSPDGKKVCYVSDMPGLPKLYVVSLDDGKPHRLQIGGGECVSPDWSAVSNKLCFSHKTGGHYVIEVMDMAKPGSTPELVTLAAGDWEAPSWGPDGRHLVCTRATAGKRELVVIDTWLKTFTPITMPGYYSLPAWQPAY